MKKTNEIVKDIAVIYVPISELKSADYNPRRHDADAVDQLKISIERYGMVDPIIVNCAPERMNIVIGGHMRIKSAKELGIESIPVVYVNIPDVAKEKELNLRLNKNTGEWDLELLAEFDESLLDDVGFSSEEIDEIFEIEDIPEEFDLKKELAKLDIKNIDLKKGDVLDLDGSRLMVGDSTIETDLIKLMNGEKADMCLTDPPYILDYLHGKKKNGQATDGFGYRRDRKYLETDELPPDFTEKWMANVHKVAQPDFSIIVYENWKNLRIIWGEME